jgi:hypothetical protein
MKATIMEALNKKTEPLLTLLFYFPFGPAD